MKKNKKSKKKVSVFQMLKYEWKSLTKPSAKQLAGMTVRTVLIAVAAAVVINVVDIGFMQFLLVLSGLM